MLAKSLVALLLLLWCKPVADDNLIDWSSTRKLTWSDFKARPDPASPNAALTSSTINVQFGYDKNGLKHSITCRFNKLTSWARVKNDYILSHEQGHFDLAEAYARKLHKNLEDYHFKKETVSDDLNKIYNEVMQDHMADQDKYDRQTNHSLDTAQQRTWKNKISNMLEEYKAYSNYSSKIP